MKKRSKHQKKLLIINTHPVNYHVPIYRLLSQKISLEVYFLRNIFSEKHSAKNKRWKMTHSKSLLDSYSSKYIANISPLKGWSGAAFINPGLIIPIAKKEFDAIFLFGYNSITSILVVLAAKFFGMPVVFKGEGDVLGERGRLKRAIKKIYLKTFFKLVDYFTYSYSKNAEYYKFYGAKKDQLVFMPCSVDNDLLRNISAHLNKEKIKQDLGVLNKKVVLFVGRLNERKSPETLIKAFLHTCQIDQNVVLLIVGDGELREQLIKMVEENPCYMDRIRFEGFKSHDDTYKYYKAADILVLPSKSDPSPKVLNEAMNFEVSLIVSDKVGTAKDLVKTNYNGSIFRVGNVDELEEQLKNMFLDEKQLTEYGKNSMNLVKEWSYEKGVNNLLCLLEEIWKND